MRFVIFSGTTEGRKLSALLAEAGANVTVCVASDYGSEEQGEIPGVEIRKGPLSPEEKKELLCDCVLCVDATHPYALEVSERIRLASEHAGVSYLRLKRKTKDAPSRRIFCCEVGSAPSEPPYFAKASKYRSFLTKSKISIFSKQYISH